VRKVVTAWRRLAGGREATDRDRPTLVACSAGVDSSALAIALSVVRPAPVIGHVVHDLRGRADALGDRDAARGLAERLGLVFVEAEAPVRGRKGNLEALARRARYAALAGMAQAHGCRYIATAHHADDQLETVLMRLIRGALGAFRAVGSLGAEGHGIRVVRPMLGMSRAEAVRICTDTGWVWKEDASNRDESFLRNAIRARVIPEIKAIRPDAAERAAVTAAVCTLAAEAVERAARLALNAATRKAEDGRGIVLGRKELAAAPMAVRCEALRLVLRDAGGVGMDKAGWRVVEPAAIAVGDHRMEPRSFRVGSIVVDIRAHEIRVSAGGRTEESDG
jgi:tRNA(Ile)-lysidine synthase